jgi:hypothetical protein
MVTLDDALRQFAVLFDQLKIPYVVMGELAVRVHGIPRPTHDLDFTIAFPRERLPELFQAVEDLGYSVPEVHQAGWVDQVAGMSLIRFRLYFAGFGIDVDVFLAESAFQQELLARRQLCILDDTTVWLVTPEDLVLLKLLASRPRDLADIGDILFTQGTLDASYMRQWALRLGIAAQLESVLAHPPE